MTSTFTNPLLDAESAQKERSERARRAYIVARDRKLSWQAYARMMTRNAKLRVELTGGTPRTDGQTIWLRVPIELGDEIAHERKLCGERDPKSKRMLCSACDVFDGIDCTQYHETSHITSDSFADMSDADLASLVRDAIVLEAEGLDDSTRGKKLAKIIQYIKPSTFVHASQIISPWLGIILNCVEDARVNEAMRQARPGTALMFQAQTNKIFEEGIAGLDGEVNRWCDQPLNMQACIGLYCKISGLDYSSWLAPKVVADLSDPEIEDITLRARTARSVGNSFRMSFRYLEALRRLGYCLAENDVEDDPKPEPEPSPDSENKEKGDTDPESGDSGEGDDSDTDSDASGEGEDSPDADSTESGDDTEAGDGDADGDPSEDDGDSDSGAPQDGEGGTPEQANGTPKSDGKGEPETGESANSDESADEPQNEAEEAGEEGSGPSESSDSLDEGADGSDKSNGSDGADEGDEDGDLHNPEYVDTGMEAEDVESLPMGTPDEVAGGLAIFGRHDDEGSVDTGNDPDDEEAIDKAIQQVDYFDSPSEAVYGVNVHTDPKDGKAWTSRRWHDDDDNSGQIKIPETILSPALMRLRRAFQANARGSYERDRKSGCVDARVLGKRVLTDDFRWFKAKREPGKRSYFVLIGLDVSGSTSRPGVISLIKQAAFAKAELCQRLGVSFAVYAHTGVYEGGKGLMLDMYQVKGPKDRWDTAAKDRLSELRPASANLDGHTLEFYRKIAQKVPATDKLVLYYTDGAMPLENYDEELEILQREIETCQRANIKLVGVGIKNSDPEKHGLDTIRLDKIEDVPRVVDDLERRLRG